MTAVLVTGIGQLVSWDEERPVRDDAAVVLDDGVVAWVGDAADAPDADERIDADGAAVIPGFVDSHSHLVFAGDRADEFDARMAGRRYEAGGIRRTVALTREATDEQLLARATALVAEMRAQGTTTVEIKSGYGLTVRDEERALRLASTLTPETTFLGAHVVPAEYADDRDAYVDLVVGEMLDACAPHARWIDVFCETGAFTVDESRRILEAGAARGLGIRMHAGAAHGVVRRGAPRRRARRREPRPRHLPLGRGCRGPRRLGHRRHPAARRRILDAAAVSVRSAPDRRGRDRRARHRLQPGLVVHLVDAVLHRRRGARHGVHAARGTARGDAGRSGCAAGDDVGTCESARPAARHPRRAERHPPRLPARCAPGATGVASQAPGRAAPPAQTGSMSDTPFPPTTRAESSMRTPTWSWRPSTRVATRGRPRSGSRPSVANSSSGSHDRSETLPEHRQVPAVGIVIFDSSVPAGQAEAAYFEAEAAEVTGADRAQALGVYNARSLAQGIRSWTETDVTGGRRTGSTGPPCPVSLLEEGIIGPLSS